MSVPRVRNKLGKKAFQFAAPSSCSDVQKDLHLSDLVTLWEFKSVLKEREYSSCGPAPNFPHNFCNFNDITF